MFALATFVLHEATAGSYGYQRDELYFISCARHLAWGYVDQPPLIALITRFVLAIFGDSLYALRLLPAAAAAGIVVIGGNLTRRMGGGLWAQGCAMLAIALAPFDLAVGSLLTMNAFEPLFWVGAAYLFAKATEDDRPMMWAAFGIVSGLGLINKYSMFFFLGACVVGIALSPARRALQRPGFMIAVAIALVIVSPTLFWQAQQGWPQLEVLRNAAAGKNIDEGAVAFYVQQLLVMSPLAAPLWLAGLYALLVTTGGRSWRWYGYAYVALSIVYAILQAKVYYMAPIYPVLFAAGAVFAEIRLARITFAKIAYPIVLMLGGLAIAPEAFPLLPLDRFLAYQHVIDVREVKMEKHPEGRVPQHFADMLGWNTLVETLSRAYEDLSPSQQREAVILTRDYGQASAIDFLGPKLGLPRAISGHNNYYLYGTRGASGKVILAVGLTASQLRAEYADVREVAIYRDAFVLPDFDNLPIYLCTKPREPLAAFWPHFKRFI